MVCRSQVTRSDWPIVLAGCEAYSGVIVRPSMSIVAAMPTADAAAGEAAPSEESKNLPARKRMKGDEPADAKHDEDEFDELKPIERPPMSKAREVRLEQNRKAARESRRRKKLMIEELQRSVIFFSRANGTLKQQNEELTRILMQVQAQVSAIESGQQTAGAAQPGDQATGATSQTQQSDQQVQANTVAAQAMYESQGFPAAAARAAAQTMNASSGAAAAPAPPGGGHALPPMQTGATMQAMANFQQAAAAAMQAAMGLNPSVAQAAAGSPGAANPQQTYNDTLNALAMQQAQFAFLPQMQQAGFMHPAAMQFWQQQQQAAATAAPAAEGDQKPAAAEQPSETGEQV